VLKIAFEGPNLLNKQHRKWWRPLWNVFWAEHSLNSVA